MLLDEHAEDDRVGQESFNRGTWAVELPPEGNPSFSLTALRQSLGERGWSGRRSHSTAVTISLLFALIQHRIVFVLCKVHRDLPGCRAKQSREQQRPKMVDWPLTGTCDLAMVIHAPITSRLDYFNLLYMGLLLKTVQKLGQKCSNQATVRGWIQGFYHYGADRSALAIHLFPNTIQRVGPYP